MKILRSEYLEENLAGVLEQKVDKLKKVDIHGLSFVFNIICVQSSSQG